MTEMKNFAPSLEHYCELFSSKESALLEKIRMKTAEFYSRHCPGDPALPASPGGYPGGQMICGPQIIGFIQCLMRLQGATRVLDIGTYTGYSAAAIAEVLAESHQKIGVKGSVITLERSKQAFELALGFFNEASLGDFIQPMLGEAMSLLALPELDKQYFDLIFIDADKASTLKYYEWAIAHLNPRGVILVDDVLWYGEVLKCIDPEESGVFSDKRAGEMHRFNQYLQNDSRVLHQLLPIRHGLQMIMLKPGKN